MAAIRLPYRPSTVCASCIRRFHVPQSAFRPFSSSKVQRADEPPAEHNALKPEATTATPDQPQNVVNEEAPVPPAPRQVPSKPSSQPQTTRTAPPARSSASRPSRSSLSGIANDSRLRPDQSSVFGLDEQELTPAEKIRRDTYHFHVYSTKHNTHITLTRPNHTPMLSLSAGNLGFQKANRGSFDAAYQLASYTLNNIRERGWQNDIKYSEIVLRGFGQGREAVTKVLLGVEGQMFRTTVVRVTDYTRLKFGGTRSRKPRRLG